MGLDFAIDSLYETGWTAEDASGCSNHVDGRKYPTEALVRQSFEEAGYKLTIRHVQLFDCYRAEWRDGQGEPGGAVVGKTAEEAAVYAMSHLRRQLLAGAKA
jgi:hypothetical protein